jgi:hypothetical protein
MKKITILFLALFLMVTFADASTWIAKPATLVFNDCTDQLTVVRYGLNYITSGDNNGKAAVYVTVNAKTTVLGGCAYFKVYGPAGNVIYTAKKRIKVFEGGDQHIFAYVPAEDIGGITISADIGVGCDCSKPGF